MENQVVIQGNLISYLVTNTEQGQETLLFLHGWRSNKEVWGKVNQLIRKSANQKINQIVIDLPGFGKSPAPKKPFSVGDYALVVKEFIEKENLKSVVLIGHSFGGRVGIKLASQFPNLISKLVLVDSAGFVSVGLKTNLISFAAGLFKPLFAPKFMQGLRESIYRALGSEDYLATPELRETYKKVIVEHLSVDMEHVITPTLIIWGENDQDTPVEFGKKMHALIPNSKFIILPSAGHFSFLDQPEEFTKVLNEFI
jgi:pimeloyl-ACP methyl ester carboxylesterase